MSCTLQRTTLKGGPFGLEIVTSSPEGPSRVRPVLFTHGAWHGAWCWEEYFLPYFAKAGFHATAFSFRGHGESEGREALPGFRIRDYQEDLELVFDFFATRYGVEPLVVGHSLGGYVVQRMLRTRVLPGCVLITPVPPLGMKRASWNMFVRHPLVTILSFLTTSPNWMIKVQSVARDSLFSPSLPEMLVQRFSARLQAESARAFLDLFVPLSVSPERVNRKALVLAAEHDHLLTQGDMAAAARAFQTRCEVIPDIAHDMMLDTKWRTAADRIISWATDSGLCEFEDTCADD